MVGFAVFCIVTGIILIYLSGRFSNQYIRKIGLGMVVFGFLIFAFGRFNVPLGPPR